MAENSRVDIDIFIDSKKAANSLGELKRSIKELKNEALQFEQGSAEFNKLTAAAGQLNDKMADVNGTVKVLSGNVTENLTRSFAGVAQAGIGAFTALKGAQALFGSENKDLQKTLVQLQGALAFSQGLKEFANLGQAAKDFKTVLASVVTTTLAQVTATRAAAAAQGQSTIAYLASSAAAGALAVANGIVSASTTVVTGLMTTFGITATAAWAAATLGVSLLIAGIIALIAYYDEIIASVKEFFGLQSDEAEEAEKSAERKVAAEEKYKQKRLENASNLAKEQIRAQLLSGKITEEEAEKKILKEDFVLNYKKLTLEAGLALQKASSKEEQDVIKADLAESLKTLTTAYQNDIKAVDNKVKEKGEKERKGEADNRQKLADEAKKDKEAFDKLLQKSQAESLNEFQKIEADAFNKRKELEDAFSKLSKKEQESNRASLQQELNRIDTEATKKREDKKLEIEAEAEKKRKEEQDVALKQRLKSQDEITKSIQAERQSDADLIQLQIDKGLANETLSAEKRIQLEADKYDKLIEIAETAGEDTERLEFEKEQAILQIQDDAAQKRIDRAKEVADAIVNTISTIAQLSLESQDTELQIEENNERRRFENRKRSIEANIKDETQRKIALDKLNKEKAASEERLEKKRLELEKKRIKSERNAAIATVAINSAILIANALKATSKSFDPVSFAIALTANLAAAAVAIVKANNALKEADAASAEFGAEGGGGGADVQVPDASGIGGDGQGGFTAPPRFNFQGEQIGGGGNFLGGAGGGAVAPIRVYVTESDITNTQNQVNVIQDNSLFGSGGG